MQDEIAIDDQDNFVFTLNRQYKFKLREGQTKSIRGDQYDGNNGVHYELVIKENIDTKIYALRNESYCCVAVPQSRKFYAAYLATVHVIVVGEPKFEIWAGIGEKFRLVVPPNRDISLRRLEIAIPQGDRQVVNVMPGVSSQVTVKFRKRLGILGMPSEDECVTPGEVEIIVEGKLVGSERTPPHECVKDKFSPEPKNEYSLWLKSKEEKRIIATKPQESPILINVNVEISKKYVMFVNEQESYHIKAYGPMMHVEGQISQFAQVICRCVQTNTTEVEILLQSPAPRHLIITPGKIFHVWREVEQLSLQKSHSISAFPGQKMTLVILPNYKYSIKLKYESARCYACNVLLIGSTIATTAKN